MTVTEKLALRMGFRIKRCGAIPPALDSGVDIAYTPRPPTLYVLKCESDEISILHEIAHWLVATPTERQRRNWWLNRMPYKEARSIESIACNVNIGLAMLLYKDYPLAVGVAHYLNMSTKEILVSKWLARTLLEINNIQWRDL